MDVELMDPVVWVRDPRTGLYLPNGSLVCCIWADEMIATPRGGAGYSQARPSIPQGWWVTSSLLGYIPGPNDP